jgi:hypothetical protein
MWRRGRKLRQECRECDWVGKERIPEEKEIVTTRNVPAGYQYGHTFEVFDRYGHTLMSSRSYPTADEARVALKKELDRGRLNETAGPYVGILWPATVTVKGEVIQ